MDEDQLAKKLTIMGCKSISGEVVNEDYCHGKEGDYKFESVTNVNFKPHPFTVGVRLVAHASDNFGGMLGKAAIEDYEEKHGSACAYKDRNGKCKIPFAEHTSDKVAFLKVKSDKELKEINELRLFLVGCKEKATKENIDGFAFVKWE